MLVTGVQFMRLSRVLSATLAVVSVQANMARAQDHRVPTYKGAPLVMV